MAGKNLLPYILLGLIEQEPKTGYDLKKDFETEIGEFWSANHSQIYTELGRMTDKGLIDSNTDYFGTKVQKTYYTITDKGLGELDKWRSSYDEQIAVNKDEFVVKLYFIRDKYDARIPEILQDQLRQRRVTLEHLKERMENIFPDEASIDKQYGHYLILDHAIRKQQEYVDWLEEALARTK